LAVISIALRVPTTIRSPLAWSAISAEGAFDGM
jgi:hypothetical protein